MSFQETGPLLFCKAGVLQHSAQIRCYLRFVGKCKQETENVGFSMHSEKHSRVL